MEELIKVIEGIAQMETIKDRRGTEGTDNYEVRLTKGGEVPLTAYLKGIREGKIGFARELLEIIKETSSRSVDKRPRPSEQNPPQEAY